MRSHANACADSAITHLQLRFLQYASISTFKATCSEHPPNLSDLSGQSDHLAESDVVAGLRLGQLHVGALQALVQYVHDLGSNVADIRVLCHIVSVYRSLAMLNHKMSVCTYISVNVRNDRAQPLETHFDVGLEARRDGGRDRKRDQ
jgi:hypothetical protein